MRNQGTGETGRAFDETYRGTLPLCTPVTMKTIPGTKVKKEICSATEKASVILLILLVLYDRLSTTIIQIYHMTVFEYCTLFLPRNKVREQTSCR